MKKIFLSACLAIASLASFGQNKSLVATIENNKASFTQTANGSVTKFELTATADQIKNLKSQAASIPEKMQLTVTPKSNTSFACVLTITHQNQAEYVHKMFVYLGIGEIKIDGVVKPVADLINALKNLK